MNPLIAVFVRRHPHDLGEHTGEVVGITDAELESNLLDSEAGEQQVLTGFLDFQVVEVFDRREAGLFLEQNREMRGRKIDRGSNVFKGNDLVDTAVHEVDGGVGLGLVSEFAGWIIFFIVDKIGQELGQTDIGIP